MRNLLLSLSRMPPLVVLLIIVALALTAGMLYSQQSSQQQAAIDAMKAENAAKGSQKGPVVYSVKDIPEGQEITQDALEVREEPIDKIPAQAMTSPSAGVGNLAAYTITSGQMVFMNAIKARAIQVGFESEIKDGMRAVTFGIDTNSGVAGFIYPGCYVDVLCITGSAADTKAAPVLSDVKVIAVGATYRKAPGESTASQASSITVLVNPSEAEKLVKAVSAGKPYLTLRNQKDHSPLATVDITSLFPKPVKEDVATDVSSLPAPPLPSPPMPGGTPDADANAPPPPPPMHEIELWSGSKKEVLSVPQG